LHWTANKEAFFDVSRHEKKVVFSSAAASFMASWTSSCICGVTAPKTRVVSTLCHIASTKALPENGSTCRPSKMELKCSWFLMAPENKNTPVAFCIETMCFGFVALSRRTFSCHALLWPKCACLQMGHLLLTSFRAARTHSRTVFGLKVTAANCFSLAAKKRCHCCPCQPSRSCAFQHLLPIQQRARHLFACLPSEV